MRPSTTSLALSNLRAVVILTVLAFHSVLAYLDFLPSTSFRFDAAPYEWQAFAIIDRQRWVGFDLFCAWQDVCLMSLMFFLSGLFVWPSLTRKGSWPFLSDRLLRIGLPLVLAVAFLMPLAYYPAYRVTAADPGIAAYWQHWQELPFWPCGPQWFLWQLLALNLVAASLHRMAPQYGDRLGRLTSSARLHPARFFVALAAVSALAYLPLALAFSPWAWTQYGPFGMQLSRPLHYSVYFFAGLGVGAAGLERSLLAADGLLARHWAFWCAAAGIGFLLWMAPTAMIMADGGVGGPLLLQIASNLGFVLACASGCFFLVAVFLRFATTRSRAFDSLSDNAYGMYLVHYVFVVWMQYALLQAELFAVWKAAVVFGITLLLSWTATAAVHGAPLGGRLIGARR